MANKFIPQEKNYILAVGRMNEKVKQFDKNLHFKIPKVGRESSDKRYFFMAKLIYRNHGFCVEITAFLLISKMLANMFF